MERTLFIFLWFMSSCAMLLYMAGRTRFRLVFYPFDWTDVYTNAVTVVFAPILWTFFIYQELRLLWSYLNTRWLPYMGIRHYPRRNMK